MTKPTRIGVVGGGQLARMLQPELTALGAQMIILDPDPNSPASANADGQVLGAYHDSAALFELAQQCDVLTVELEDVGVETLAQIRDQGTPVYPDPDLIALIRNKYQQKCAYKKLGIPTSDFVEVDPEDPVAFEAFGYPLVQKTQTGGYDGRGVQVLRSPADFEKRLREPSFVERLVDFQMEVGVMVARTPEGDVIAFEPTEMVLDPELNLLDLLLAPARLTETQRQAARQLACDVIEKLGGVGLFGVELFLTADGTFSVNEIAPRAHNSGHHSIEACQTSQFGQQARILLGLPLGSVAQPRPGAMVNLIGAAGYTGATEVLGLQEALALDGVSLHMYGKAECRPGRKMGHFSVVCDNVEQVLNTAQRAKSILSVKGVDKL